jgi:N-acyl-D-amino-acid deacylase
MVVFSQSEDNVGTALGYAHTMVGSDSLSLHGGPGPHPGKPHPRSYGTFPRVLGEYVRDQRLLSLGQAIHKMTGLPARRLRLTDRGVIRTGARADLVIFDPKRIADIATYDNPHRYPEAIDHVIVNGRFVVRDGQHTGILPGRVLTPP